MKRSFPFYKQPDLKDCGPTCLRIVAKYYGKLISLPEIRELSETTRVGSNLLKLSEAAESIGFKSIGVKLNYQQLKETSLPLIVHWNKNHFVVVYKIRKNVIFISDPAYGLIEYSKEDFLSHWIGNNANDNSKEGVALLLEITPKFKNQEWKDSDKKSLSILFQYLFKYKRMLLQLCIGLLVGMHPTKPVLTASLANASFAALK